MCHFTPTRITRRGFKGLHKPCKGWGPAEEERDLKEWDFFLEETRPLPLTHAVVADAAVRGAGRAEDLAGVAVLELHDLVVDLEVFNARRRALALWHGAVGGL